jgi:hypothetical protein
MGVIELRHANLKFGSALYQCGSLFRRLVIEFSVQERLPLLQDSGCSQNAEPPNTDYSFHSLLKPHPMEGVMLIAYAIKTLRDEAPRNAASTPPVEAVLAAGYGRGVG